jgi:hypothetical protein
MCHAKTTLVFFVVQSGRVTYSLRWEKVSPDDYGIYSCNATNDLGKVLAHIADSWKTFSYSLVSFFFLL